MKIYSSLYTSLMSEENGGLNMEKSQILKASSSEIHWLEVIDNLGWQVSEKRDGTLCCLPHLLFSYTLVVCLLCL